MDESKRPFTFYKHLYDYKSENTGTNIVQETYKKYVADFIQGYIAEGGDTSALREAIQTKDGTNLGPILNEDGTINMEALIADCEEHDAEMMSRDIKDFVEGEYDLKGFLTRRTEIKQNIKGSIKPGKDDYNPEAKAIVDRQQAIAARVLGKLRETDIEYSEDPNAARIKATEEMLFAIAASSPYIPRTNAITSGQITSDGALEQVGCGQGKTTILMIASYINMQADQKVMNTSANPILVRKNFDEFIPAYQMLGADLRMCAVTRNNEGKDVLITREIVRK